MQDYSQLERFGVHYCHPTPPSLFAHPIVTVIGYLVIGGFCVFGFILDVVAINAIL